MSQPNTPFFEGLGQRLGLSRREMTAFGAALAVAVLAAVVLGAITEDVFGHDGLTTSDAAHLHWFTNLRTTPSIDAAKLFTLAGDVPVLIVLAAIVTVVLWRSGVPRWLAIAPAVSLGLAGSIVYVTKATANRARPPVSLHLVTESNASFPSGHATDSTALYVALALVLATAVLHRMLGRVLAIVVAGALAAGIGLSRLILGVHWPTDVVAGWALGLLVAVTVTTVATIATRHPGGAERDRIG